MPPPESSEAEEEWEELGAQVTENLHYVRVSVSAQGPPIAHASTPGLTGHLFSHRYKFSECRYSLDEIPEIPVGERARWLVEIQGDCLKAVGDHKLFAAMALRGWYWYRSGKEIWTNAAEEDCKKWGSYPPAMVHCEAVPRRDDHHVVLYGNFRFPPGIMSNVTQAAECDTLWAVLTLNAPHKHERENISNYVDPADPCDWPQR